MAKGFPIMIQGIHSDAGKSVIATALCRIFHEDGYMGIKQLHLNHRTCPLIFRKSNF